jgi:hypothetical protein
MRITSFNYTQLTVKFALVVPLIDPVNVMKLDRSSRFVRIASMLAAPERGERWIVNPAAICKIVLLTFVMALHLFEKFIVSLLVSQDICCGQPTWSLYWNQTHPPATYRTLPFPETLQVVTRYFEESVVVGVMESECVH